MYINTLGCVIIPYFNNYLKESNCKLIEKSFKKCSYVLNIKDFITKMKLDDFGDILCNELDENKTLYKCLNEYQASQFYYYLKTEEGINDMIKCILPQF